MTLDLAPGALGRNVRPEVVQHVVQRGPESVVRPEPGEGAALHRYCGRPVGDRAHGPSTQSSYVRGWTGSGAPGRLGLGSRDGEMVHGDDPPVSARSRGDALGIADILERLESTRFGGRCASGKRDSARIRARRRSWHTTCGSQGRPRARSEGRRSARTPGSPGRSSSDSATSSSTSTATWTSRRRGCSFATHCRASSDGSKGRERPRPRIGRLGRGRGSPGAVRSPASAVTRPVPPRRSLAPSAPTKTTADPSQGSS